MKILLALFVLMTTPGSGAELPIFRVIGIHAEILHEQPFSARIGSLGEQSDAVFKNAAASHKLESYVGTEGGVEAVNGLGSALEMISQTEMNAYGWCYRVDGKVSDLLADQYILTGEERVVEWFYAYAHLDKNTWTAMCVPADHPPASR